MATNREYKDRLFRLLFGDERNKDNILSLYNALCNTTYTNPDDIQIYTMDDVIYIKMKNDVSVLLDSYLHLWEQQSTFNPNMPLRGLLYFGKMYDRYVDENKLNIYGKKLLKIPTPRYTVLYNGVENQQERIRLKLSDSFIHPDESGDFEWTADMINLNEGKNDELLEHCRPLKEYMILVNEIRKNGETMEAEEAVDAAVTYCIEHNILREFLIKHRAEVKDVCITEFDEKRFADDMREEGFEEGCEVGQNLLVQAVERLRNGETSEQLRASGIDEKTITLAQKIK